MAPPLIPPPPDYSPEERDDGIIPPPPDAGGAGAVPARPENWLTKGYREYVADPLTKAVASAPKYMIGDLDVRNPDAGAIREAPIMSESTARMLVPQTPAGGAAALASIPFGGTYLRAILAPFMAAGGASLLSGNEPVEAAKDAGMAGLAGAAGKGLTDVGSWGYRSLPYVKDRIMEANARGLAGRVADIDPAVGQAVADQAVSPFMKGGTTMAKMRQAATGGDIQNAASGTIEAAVQQVDALAGNPRYQGNALARAYGLVPQVDRDEIIGAIDPAGFTLKQAQSIRGYLGSKAFSMSPAGQGITPAGKQSLWAKVSDEITAPMPPEARALWDQSNRQYGGTSVINEFLNEGNAKQGLPNRMFLNRNALSDFLDANREDLIRRMGREQFDAVVNDVLGGAQPGTRDILTPGAGTPMAALMQSIGRGTNTGSIQGLGVPLRTALPGLGSEWTGRRVGSDPNLEALLRILTQKGAEQFRQAQQGQPVKIGDTYGR